MSIQNFLFEVNGLNYELNRPKAASGNGQSESIFRGPFQALHKKEFFLFCYATFDDVIRITFPELKIHFLTLHFWKISPGRFLMTDEKLEDFSMHKNCFEKVKNIQREIFGVLLAQSL